MLESLHIDRNTTPFALFSTLGAFGLVVSLALIALTVVVAPRLIARLPHDHFSAPDAPHPSGMTSMLRSIWLTLLGAIVALAGVIMLFTPGPGIVLILIGLSLARFPGRRHLIARLVSVPSVFRALNWIRQQRGCQPFIKPDVRPVNDTASKRLYSIVPIIAGVLLVSALNQTPASAQDAEAVAGTSADEIAEQIADTARRLEALDAQLEANHAERERLGARMAEAEAAAAERSTRVQGLEQDIARFESELNTLESRIAAERATVTVRRQRIAETMRRAQRAEDTNPVAVLLAHEDPAMADRLSIWTGYVLRAQREQIELQKLAIDRIEAAQQRALKDRNWLAHIRRKASSQRDTQLARGAESLAGINTVDSRITATTRSVETLRADASRLATLLDELRAAEAARSGYFEAGKGDWPLPVDGQIDARFGDIKSVGRLVWDGWFIRASSGVPVNAVADGEVVYSDWLNGFGMLVILDHGDGYMTLYGGNRKVVALVGDWVESGATIATVGDSGGQTTSGLYFEIRQDARPVDPAPWIVN